MNKTEEIVSAAVRFYRDEDDDVGVVVMGLTHDHCGEIYNQLTYEGYVECNEGFITNKGNFVTKYEALEITGMGNQLRFKDRKYLLPQDLYL